MPRRPGSHVDDPAAVGRRLKAAREAAGLSQRDLAFENCTAAYVSRIEAGVRVPSYQVLRELARRLGTSAEYLATGDGMSSESDPLFEARMELRLGNLDAARIALAALAESTTGRDPARARALLGELALQDGDVETADQLLTDALEGDALPAYDRYRTASALGRTKVAAGRYEEALAIFETHLDRARAANDLAETITFSVLLANTLIDRENFGRAEEILAAILDSAREAADPMTRASLFWTQSRLHSSQGRFELAARYARTVVSILDDSEHSADAARALLLLAHIENERGESATALELVEKGLPALASSGEPSELALFQLERARALLALGEREEAASIALGVVPVLRQTRKQSAARGFALAASVFRTLGDRERAVELYELAADTLVTHDRHLLEVYSALAELYEEIGRNDDALRILKLALAVRSGSGLVQSEATTLT